MMNDNMIRILRHWPEIYCHDIERKQDFQEVIETYHSVQKAHTACGYQLIEVPKVSVIDRVHFILDALDAL